MDEDELSTVFEMVLWGLRKKRSIHYNTIAAGCRRSLLGCSNQAVSVNLQRAMKEGRVEMVGSAKYKVINQQPVRCPLSPPPTSPPELAAGKQRRNARLPKSVDAKNRPRSQHDRTGTRSSNGPDGCRRAGLEKRLPAGDLEADSSQIITAQGAQIDHLETRCSDLAIQNVDLSRRLSRASASVADVRRRMEVSRAAIHFALSQTRSLFEDHLKMISSYRDEYGRLLVETGERAERAVSEAEDRRLGEYTRLADALQSICGEQEDMLQRLKQLPALHK